MDEVARAVFGQPDLSQATGSLEVHTTPLPLPENGAWLLSRLAAMGETSSAFTQVLAAQERTLDEARVLDTTDFGKMEAGTVPNTESVRHLAQWLMRISFTPDVSKVSAGSRGIIQRRIDVLQSRAPNVVSYMLNPAAHVVRLSAAYAPFVGPAPGDQPTATEFEDLMADIFGVKFQEATASDRIGMFLFALWILRQELVLGNFPLDGRIDLLWLGLLLGPAKANRTWRTALAHLDADMADALPLELPVWGFSWYPQATAPSTDRKRLLRAAKRLKTVPVFIYDIVADTVLKQRVPLFCSPIVAEPLVIEAPLAGRPVRWFGVLLDVRNAREAAEHTLLQGTLDVDLTQKLKRYVFALGVGPSTSFRAPPFPFLVFGLALGDAGKYVRTRDVKVYPRGRCLRCYNPDMLLAGIEERRTVCTWDMRILPAQRTGPDLIEAHFELDWHWKVILAALGSATDQLFMYTVAEQAEAAVRFWGDDVSVGSGNPIVRLLAETGAHPPHDIDHFTRVALRKIAWELLFAAQALERIGRPANDETSINDTRGKNVLREKQRAQELADAMRTEQMVRYQGQHSVDRMDPDYLLLESDLESPLIAVGITAHASVVTSDGIIWGAMLDILQNMREYQAQALPGIRQRALEATPDPVGNPYALDNEQVRKELLGHYIKVKGMAERFNKMLHAQNPDLQPLPNFDVAFTNELEVLRA